VALGRGDARGLVGGGVAGDQAEPLLAGVEAVAAQAAPDAVVGDEEAAPALAAKLGGDAGRTETRMAEREGHDPLLDERGELVRYARPPSLPRAQDLEPVTLDHPLPAVVRGAVDAEGTAGGGNSDPAGQVDELQPVAEEDVILRHAAHSFPPIGLEGEGEPRNGRHPVKKAGCRPLKPLRRPHVSGPLGDSPT